MLSSDSVNATLIAFVLPQNVSAVCLVERVEGEKNVDDVCNLRAKDRPAGFWQLFHSAARSNGPLFQRGHFVVIQNLIFRKLRHDVSVLDTVLGVRERFGNYRPTYFAQSSKNSMSLVPPGHCLVPPRSKRRKEGL